MDPLVWAVKLRILRNISVPYSAGSHSTIYTLLINPKCLPMVDTGEIELTARSVSVLGTGQGLQHVAERSRHTSVTEHGPTNFHQIATVHCLVAESTAWSRAIYLVGSATVVLLQTLVLTAILFGTFSPPCSNIRPGCPAVRPAHATAGVRVPELRSP